MHDRVVTINGAEHIDEGVAFVRDAVDTNLSQQKGFRGITVSADRAAGVFGVLTTWETEADRDASEGTSAKMRDQGLGIIGGMMTVELFEEVLVEIKSPPVVGLPLMITRVSQDPAKVDGNLSYFKSDVLPLIVGSPGFCAVRQMIDRQAGKGLVGTVWESEAARAAAAEDAKTRRSEAADRGVVFDEISFREIMFAHLQ